ncbi:MAG: thiolase family protein [Dehalococcoidia bacterium]|uniref:thiolase family protein n=1 Tax=Candidatus Amarobacter glycogenicus TaxID=3140699 RepID=UPI0031351669|nr:thiolase family protein [Dehalococcoidia bacterium]MBK8561740.1 thiolase family protein [Dehalococcoidia bacterium]
MEDVVITSGVRTAIGKFQGSFADVPASDLGAHVIREAVARAGIAPESVDQVIMGIVGQAAEDAYLSRHSTVKAGLPIGTPAMNVNRICGSGLEAINTASRIIQSGDADVVVAGGAENMTRMPFYLRKARGGYRLGHDSIEDGIIHMLSDPFKGYHMGITAENLAEQFEVSRVAQDEFSAESQRRAIAAIEAGRFVDQIAPMTVKIGREDKVFDVDEYPRATTPDALGKLRPAFKEGGVVTAGNASGINDGAAAVTVMSASKAKELGATPRLRIVARAEAGVDPSIMGSGPIPAIRKALAKASMNLDQIDCIELNEAFASVSCACSSELSLDPAKVNPNGGAIALGHPLGATGAILTVKLMYELERTGGRFGIVSLCIGGGQGIATIFERVN